jgi:hypothetical protein
MTRSRTDHDEEAATNGQLDVEERSRHSDDSPTEQPEAFLVALRPPLGSSRPLEKRRQP